MWSGVRNIYLWNVEKVEIDVDARGLDIKDVKWVWDVVGSVRNLYLWNVEKVEIGVAARGLDIKDVWSASDMWSGVCVTYTCVKCREGGNLCGCTL